MTRRRRVSSASTYNRDNSADLPEPGSPVTTRVGGRSARSQARASRGGLRGGPRTARIVAVRVRYVQALGAGHYVVLDVDPSIVPASLQGLGAQVQAS